MQKNREKKLVSLLKMKIRSSQLISWLTWHNLIGELHVISTIPLSSWFYYKEQSTERERHTETQRHRHREERQIRLYKWPKNPKRGRPARNLLLRLNRPKKFSRNLRFSFPNPSFLMLQTIFNPRVTYVSIKRKGIQIGVLKVQFNLGL